MGWDKYAEPLASGQSIAHEQLIELWDAFRERLDGALLTGYNADNWTKFADSGLVSSRIGTISGISPSGPLIENTIRPVSARYLISDDNPARWGAGSGANPPGVVEENNILWKAAEDLGISSSEFESIFSVEARSINITRKFNVMRRAIQKMNWAVVSIANVYDDPVGKTGDVEPTWPAARDSFLSESEGGPPITGNFAIVQADRPGGDYRVSGQRVENDDMVNLPNIDIFFNYDLKIWRTTAASTHNFGAKIIHTWGSEQIEGNCPSTTFTEFLITGTGLSETGEFGFSMFPAGYNDAGELDDWEPGAGGFNTTRIIGSVTGGVNSRIFIKPSFQFGDDP